jgi:C4-dicarboxylate transporter, DctQ subunit
LSSSFDLVLDVFMFLAAAIIGFLMIAVCWDVLARAFAGKPVIWVLEFTEYGLLYITFLSGGWLLKNEGHVNNDLLLARLSTKNGFLLNTMTSVLGMIICLLITWFGAAVSLEKLQSGAYQPTPVETPDFPIFVIIPVGFFLLSIQFLRRGHRNLVQWKEAGAKAIAHSSTGR